MPRVGANPRYDRGMTLRGQPGAPYYVEPIDETAPAIAEWDGGWNTFDTPGDARAYVEARVRNSGFVPEDFTIANDRG